MENNAAVVVKRRRFTPIFWIVAAALLAILFALIIAGSSYDRPVRGDDAVPVGSGGGVNSELNVRGFVELEGTDLAAMELGQSVSDSMFGNSYGDWQQRNIVFVDQTTGKSSRLLPDNNQFIEDISYFPNAPSSAKAKRDDIALVLGGDREISGQPKAPIAYYMAVVSNRPSHSEGVEILVGTLANRQQGVVLRGNLAVDESWMIDARRLGLILRKPDGLYFAEIDIPGVKLLRSVKIDLG